jgi:hypothetical protein
LSGGAEENLILDKRPPGRDLKSQAAGYDSGATLAEPHRKLYVLPHADDTRTREVLRSHGG